MAKKGTKDPEGYDNIPTLSHLGVKSIKEKDHPKYHECWWSKYGHTDPSFGTRAKGGNRKKYQENYDRIKWDK